MIRKYQFSHHLAGIHHTQGTGTHHHSFCTTGGTGGSQITASFHLHDTDTARSRIILNASSLQINMAKGRYIYTDFPCGFQDSRAFGYGNIMAVYLQGYLFFFHFLSVYKVTVNKVTSLRGNLLVPSSTCFLVPLNNIDCFEFTACHAHAALNALVRIDDMRFAHITQNGIRRTMFKAKMATDT